MLFRLFATSRSRTLHSPPGATSFAFLRAACQLCVGSLDSWKRGDPSANREAQRENAVCACVHLLSNTFPFLKPGAGKRAAACGARHQWQWRRGRQPRRRAPGERGPAAAEDRGAGAVAPGRLVPVLPGPGAAGHRIRAPQRAGQRDRAAASATRNSLPGGLRRLRLRQPGTFQPGGPRGGGTRRQARSHPGAGVRVRSSAGGPTCVALGPADVVGRGTGRGLPAQGHRVLAPNACGTRIR